MLMRFSKPDMKPARWSQQNLETKAQDAHTAWGKHLWGCSHVQDMLTLKQIKLKKHSVKLKQLVQIYYQNPDSNQNYKI